jgi:hypothetical protein
MGVRGYIDGVIGGSLHGWAWDEEEPARRVVVRGRIDGTLLGTARAAEPRGDLARNGIGDGGHGFRIPLAGPLEPGTHAVAVVAVEGGAPLQLSADWIALDEGGRPRSGITLVADETDLDSIVAPPPTGVVGQAGWIFPGSEPELNELSGRVPVPHAVVDAQVERVVRLHALGDDLQFVALAAALPAKLHVYPEHLPAGLAIDPAQRVARRVEARLRDSPREALLDLYPALRDARVHGRLFTRTGGELTWTGAFHAYRAVARALAPRVPALEPLPWGALDLGVHEPVHDSLVGAALVRPAEAPEPWPEAEPALGDGLRLTARPASDATAGVRRLERAAGEGAPRLLVAGDPGTDRIARLLAEHASTTLLTGGDRLDEELIRAERPDVVVCLLTDAGLLRRAG